MAYIKKGFTHLKGESNGNWKGGLPKCSVCGKQLKVMLAKTCILHRPVRAKKARIMHNGYYLVYMPSHPFAGSNGYVKEHRVIMEKHLGRILGTGELIHHKNHIPTDNRISNLMVVGKTEHQHIHHLGRTYKK